jgi:bifunctional NMN adenylyltransferase/nudix hydrolase
MKREGIADVGIIVGRFQVDDLHEGHKNFIDAVSKTHSRVIIFLGLSPAKCSTNNPLDYDSRKKMISRHYPDITVLYIKDMHCDKLWSSNLDEQIDNMIGPNHTACLYGGRDSFIKHYDGKFDTTELRQEVFTSGTVIRKQLALQSKGTVDFNSGVVWATLNQWPACLPTVDIAIFSEDCKEILLGRKPNEKEYRLIGGFVNSGETFENAAARETREETGLETADLNYSGSFVIDDWRYRKEQNKITTMLFTSKRVFGRPKPNDDIEELRWFKFNGDILNDIVDNHKVLIEHLMKTYSSIVG